jgi:4-amino-4-deoxy-L-arabinose transferase-like glycosyltransferase
VAATGGTAGLTRLFAADMGGQVSWLLPAALIALTALLWGTRHAPRTDRNRAAALVWGGWLLVTGAVFSYMAGIIHSYYTVALAPAIGALVGIGAVQLWKVRDGWPGHERSWFGRGTLAAGVIVTALWSCVLLGRSPGWYPWLRVLVLLAGFGGAAALIAGRWWSADAARPAASRLALAVMPCSLALAAVLAGPAAYSLNSAATPHTGALPTAGPAVTAFGPGGRAGGPAGRGPFGRGGFGRGGGGLGGAGGGGGGFGQGRGGGLGRGGLRGGGGLGGSTQVSSALSTLLRDGASGYRWTAATVSSDGAAPLQLASGEPVMAIGGFNGTDPAPTLAQFQRYVADHQIHYFIGDNRDSFGGGTGEAAKISTWVRQHFTARTVGGETVYDLG